MKPRELARRRAQQRADEEGVPYRVALREEGRRVAGKESESEQGRS